MKESGSDEKVRTLNTFLKIIDLEVEKILITLCTSSYKIQMSDIQEKLMLSIFEEYISTTNMELLDIQQKIQLMKSYKKYENYHYMSNN